VIKEAEACIYNKRAQQAAQQLGQTRIVGTEPPGGRTPTSPVHRPNTQEETRTNNPSPRVEVGGNNGPQLGQDKKQVRTASPDRSDQVISSTGEAMECERGDMERTLYSQQDPEMIGIPFRFGNQQGNCNPNSGQGRVERAGGTIGGLQSRNRRDNRMSNQSRGECMESEGRARGGEMVQVQVVMRPEIDLNRSNGSRSWSIGIGGAHMCVGHELQLAHEVRIEVTNYSSGSTLRGQVRGYNDMTMCAGWLINQGIRHSAMGSPLRSRFSNWLQRRTRSRANACYGHPNSCCVEACDGVCICGLGAPR
jgi:hypothetical protein